MSAGYSYTTLIGGQCEQMQVRVSFYLDERAWIEVFGANCDDPHLHIALGDVSVNISPRAHGTVTAGDVRIARKLADHAAAYAAEVERRLTTTPAPETGGTAA